MGGTVVGDGAMPIARIAGVEDADSETLTFATDERYLAAALQSRAAAVLVDASVSRPAPEKPLLVVENVRLALARLLEALRPQRPRALRARRRGDRAGCAPRGRRVHRRRCVRRTACHGRRRQRDWTRAYVGDDASIGESAWLHAHASVMERCRIGNRVVLHAGSVIGSEGFGWAFVEGRLERIPQVGNVVLDDDVEIGANSCVDRAQTGSTQIGEGTKIDNLVQIGHNCRIGKHCALASLTGLAGSTVVGDYVKIAGQVGTRGHMTIGSRSTVAGQSGVWGDVAEGITVSGNPAREHRDELRREVMIRKLPKLVARVDALSAQSSPNDRTELKQATLAAAMRFEGIGLHSGELATVDVEPAHADSGIVFLLRSPHDPSGTVSVPAVAENVVDTSRATVIGRDGASVSTTEHLLSALFACGVSNALDRRRRTR